MTIYCTQCGKRIKESPIRQEDLNLDFCNRDCTMNWEQTRKCYVITRVPSMGTAKKKLRYYDSFDCLWTNTFDTHDIFFSAFDAHDIIKNHSLSNAFLLGVGPQTKRGKKHADRISKVQRQKEKP